ncbi:hypothetical protein DFH11DRAFT_1625148 [Phellopilus nigrolimitatus]|nr:hypothetical protein DFH11DRAFT_1625148 [Phellopilus nigrolimitatus]
MYVSPGVSLAIPKLILCRLILCSVIMARTLQTLRLVRIRDTFSTMLTMNSLCSRFPRRFKLPYSVIDGRALSSRQQRQVTILFF